MFLSSRKYDPGCSSRIRIPDPDFYSSRIPESKIHRIPDPDPQHRIFLQAANEICSAPLRGRKYSDHLHVTSRQIARKANSTGSKTVWYVRTFLTRKIPKSGEHKWDLDPKQRQFRFHHGLEEINWNKLNAPCHILHMSSEAGTSDHNISWIEIIRSIDRK